MIVPFFIWRKMFAEDINVQLRFLTNGITEGLNMIIGGLATVAAQPVRLSEEEYKLELALMNKNIPTGSPERKLWERYDKQGKKRKIVETKSQLRKLVEADPNRNCVN